MYIFNNYFNKLCRRWNAAVLFIISHSRLRTSDTMTHNIVCFRCGTSLGALSLPFGRRDGCPACGVHLHVCKMCRFYDPAVPKQCLEDDAEAVHEKEKVNFCDWYEP